VTELPLLSIDPPDGRRPLVFAWGVSSYFGWGLYGLNLALSLASHPIFSPVAAMEFGPGDLVLDPLREHLIQGVGALSADLWATLAALPQPEARINAPVLMGLGKDLHSVASAGGKFLTGQPPIGVTFIEHSTLSPVGRQRADQFALIVAGSSWNESVLRANGIAATTTVLQGVDTSLFHPAPSTGRLRDRFVVFSGGKLEYRKGQDLVVKAFRAFQQRHAEALLLTAWNTSWAWADPFLAAGTNTVPAVRGEDGWVDTAGWAIANGVPAHALIALGKVPNIAMPHVMREADVALFPNRCEGGTNLVAMECMACGIPTILSANTGHLDLLARDGVAYRLERQGAASCEGYETRDWGESDVEEILEKLEAAWQDRREAAAVGSRGAAFIAPLTWERQTTLLLRAIDPLLP
jgi:glycosyltransferase involved in cell wall biosynthesis